MHSVLTWGELPITVGEATPVRDSYGDTWDTPSGAGRGCWGLWDVGESPSVGASPALAAGVFVDLGSAPGPLEVSSLGDGADWGGSS